MHVKIDAEIFLMVKIVVDMMGGDNGAKPTIQAVQKFLKDHDDVEIIAVGDEKILEPIKDIVKIIPSKTVTPMECSVLQAMRDKESSVYKAVSATLSENADAVLSAGSTGAFLSLCTLVIKKIDGVDRPALITQFPTLKDDKYVVLLDVGATSDNNANELAQFAKIGDAYYQAMYDKKHPEIYLISNGTEEGKGNALVKEAYALLKDNENFKGYIEARNVFAGDADVVVFDGFTGNVFLKGSEGMAKMMGRMMKDAFLSSFSSKMGYLLAKKGLSKMLDKMNYKRVGGALLVGVNKVAVKAHGNADVESFYGSLNVAYNAAKKGFISKIKENLKL